MARAELAEVLGLLDDVRTILLEGKSEFYNNKSTRLKHYSLVSGVRSISSCALFISSGVLK